MRIARKMWKGYDCVLFSYEAKGKTLVDPKSLGPV
jgi:hypothetical protein